MKVRNEVITDDGKLAQIFNEYFVNIVPSLGITSFHKKNDNVNNDNIDNTIKKFEGHPSLAAIKKQMRNTTQISLSKMLVQTKQLQLLKKLNRKKRFKI